MPSSSSDTQRDAAAPPAEPFRDDFTGDLQAIARIGAVNKILDVVGVTTGMGFTAVARVTDRRWVAMAVRDRISFGLKPGGELKVETTICDEIRQSGHVVVFDDAAADTVFCDHPTPGYYGFRSYISVPVTLPDGRFFGTLCAIDPKPARVNTPQTIEMFKLFADLIGMHLAAQERMAATQAALLSERETAQLRDQFMAVLGHDLRNPLSAIQSGVQLLELMLPQQNEEAFETLEMMQRSVARMAGLIGNVLDFARGRLGGGIPVNRVPAANLAAALEQVVTELQTAWPARTVRRDIAVSRPVDCDAARIGQMLSNLLANALAHGDPTGEISVRARCCDDDSFELSVANRGETIPPHVIAQMFAPFSRGSAKPGQQGLGLGLYIASEIARAHGGELGVTSADGQTCFTFRMPAAASG